MIAIISADIIKSTSLDTGGLIELRRQLLRLFDKLREDMPGFWARIIKGDSIECYVPDYWRALRIAILIKLFVRIFADGVSCSYLLRHYGIRYSIGIGGLKFVSKEEDIIDGPAIYISGRNLDSITHKGDVYSAFALESDPLGIKWLLDSYVLLIDNLINSYSTKQSQVVFYKLLGYKEKQIAALLDIYQSSVNSRSSLAQWGLLDTSLKDFENFLKNKICG